MFAPRRAVHLSALLLGATICIAPPALAGTITWQLAGTIELAPQSCSVFGGFCDPYGHIADRLAEVGLEPETRWMARFSFSPSAPPVPYPTPEDVLDSRVDFPEAQVFVSLELGSLEAESDASGSGYASVLLYEYLYDDVLVLGAPVFGGAGSVTLDSVQLALLSSLSAFSPFALPIDPPSIADLAEGSRLRILGRALVPGKDVFNPNLVPAPFEMTGRIESFVRVPEPSALALAGVAGLAIAKRRCGRSRGASRTPTAARKPT